MPDIRRAMVTVPAGIGKTETRNYSLEYEMYQTVQMQKRGEDGQMTIAVINAHEIAQWEASGWKRVSATATEKGAQADAKGRRSLLSED